MVAASGADCRTEVLSSHGRMVLLVELTETRYVTEFKCDQSADTAIRQIRDKGYAEPFLKDGKKIVLLGVNFSSEERNIAEWQVEVKMR